MTDDLKNNWQDSMQAESILLSRSMGALVGSAVGDALGWPIERNSGNRTSFKPAHSGVLKDWLRRTGQPYSTHEEPINAGEYSDDTQLVIATARSLLTGVGWWNHFTQVELPFWTLYERGGGRATLKASRSWLSGTPPWVGKSDSANIQSYFSAGANGVAMRISPHIIRDHAVADFERIRCEIVRNGIATHGHPRALVSAAAYGYALWTAFRSTGPLKFGQLVDEVLDGYASWRAMSQEIESASDWKEAAVGAALAVGKDYDQLWREAGTELLDLLSTVRSQFAMGSAILDSQVLQQLGCFGREAGSGTITVAATLFLATKYAADPEHGIIAAANAKGADTDTIASMVGALLGSIHGEHAFASLTPKLQDRDLIRKIGRSLIAVSGTVPNTLDRRIQKRSLDTAARTIEKANVDSKIELPDGRQAQLIRRSQLNSLTRASVTVARLITDDGQTMVLKFIRRDQKKEDDTGGEVLHRTSLEGPLFNSLGQISILIPVRNIGVATKFYEQVTGLIALDARADRVLFPGGIVLRLNSNDSASSDDAISRERELSIAIRVKNASDSFDKAVRANARITERLSTQQKWQLFRCLDPDSTQLIIYSLGGDRKVPSQTKLLLTETEVVPS